MRFTWARTAPLMLVLAMALLSGCPEPIDDSGDFPIRRKPSPTPTLGGNIGGATPTPAPGSSASPGGSIDTTLKTPTPFDPNPTPTPTLAPLTSPVPVVTQPTPDATTLPVPTDPVGQQ